MSKCGFPQGFVLRPILLNAFISEIDSGTGWTLSRFVSNIKLSDIADTLEGRDVVQRDLHRLE